jgi:hypothetical protein
MNDALRCVDALVSHGSFLFFTVLDANVCLYISRLTLLVKKGAQSILRLEYALAKLA